MPTAGQRILAADFTDSASSEDSTAQSNITATSGALSAGSPTVSVTFTAPTSGKALVSIGMRCRDDGAASSIVLDWELREDDVAGDVILATGSVDRRMEISIDSASSRTFNWTRDYLATGLTPGQVYYIRLMFYATPTGSADIIHRRLHVVPIPA